MSNIKQRTQVVTARIVDKKLDQGWDPYSQRNKYMLGLCAILIMLSSSSTSLVGCLIGATAGLTAVSIIKGMRSVE
jgi:hypothetical protein